MEFDDNKHYNVLKQTLNNGILMGVREVPSILTFLKREKIPYHSYKKLHNKVEGIKYMSHTSQILQHQLDHKACNVNVQ